MFNKGLVSVWFKRFQRDLKWGTLSWHFIAELTCRNFPTYWRRCASRWNPRAIPPLQELLFAQLSPGLSCRWLDPGRGTKPCSWSWVNTVEDRRPGGTVPSSDRPRPMLPRVVECWSIAWYASWIRSLDWQPWSSAGHDFSVRPVQSPNKRGLWKFLACSSGSFAAAANNVSITFPWCCHSRRVSVTRRGSLVPQLLAWRRFRFFFFFLVGWMGNKCFFFNFHLIHL